MTPGGRNVRARPIGALILIAAAFTGCGSSEPEAAAAPDRQNEIRAIVSDYLSDIIDTPGAVRDENLGAATVMELNVAVSDQPTVCSESVAVVSRQIARTDLSAPAKRKRVLDRMVPVYSDCP